MANTSITAREALTQSRLKEALTYNPDTGEFTWLVTNSNRSVAGKTGGGYGAKGYYRVSVFGKRYFAHRLAWFYMTGEWPAEIDHINGVRDDNRFANLRIATRQENCWNSGKKRKNSSGYNGVNYDKRSGRWLARARDGEKRVNLGLYDTAEEAARVRDAFAVQHQGEFFRPATS